MTAKFIREVLELPVASVEVLEGNQIHTQEHLEDTVFSTSVDVRARLDNGTEVIIEIQVLKQEYFLNRFHYYLAAQLVENVQQKRQTGHTHAMYDDMQPVYGIAILEKTLLPDEDSPINVYEMRHIHHGGPLLSTYKDGKTQNLLRVAFLELDKYNETESNTVNIAQRQWLEFFGNRPFSQAPDQVIQRADALLEPVNWTKEERDMIDEKIRIRENWEMSLATAKADAREEGLEEGLE